MITIESVTNGYICTNTSSKERVVFVSAEDMDDDLENMQSLLYYVLEELGCYGSKHDERRIRVVIQKRDA